MPRTNTEIDRDLEKTGETVRGLERELLENKNAITAVRTESTLRDGHFRELLSRLETAHEKLRQVHDETRTNLTELKTEFRELKRTFEETQKQRWALILGVILAIVGVLFGLGKDFLNGRYFPR